MENSEKELLLKEIEKLLSFDGNETSVNPDYLQYFSLEELVSIREKLRQRHDRMVEENREWMRQFKKED